MKPFSLKIKDRIVAFDRPAVMAIINVTPDSFHASSRCRDYKSIAERAAVFAEEGADIIDLGACSTRPGSQAPAAEEEMERLAMAIAAVREAVGDMPLSIDTFRAGIARRCVEDFGADIVNDVSGGNLDPSMFDAVAGLRVPYVLTHSRGTSADMQSLTGYPTGVTAGVIAELAPKLERLSLMGVDDVIVDPGFGFAKTLDQNYQLLHDLEAFAMLGRPVLVGVSRKSMITDLLGITADCAGSATNVLNVLALERGASILRVHDVMQTRQAVDIFTRLHRT